VVLAVVGLVAVLGVATGAVARWLGDEPAAGVKAGKPVQVEIVQGSSTADIAALLAEKGVVDSALWFRWDARQAGADGRLRAGVYDLATGMPNKLVIERLREGPPVTYVEITIPEGWVIEQIAERVAERLPTIDQDEFITLAKTGAAEFAAEHPYLEGAYEGSLEGYLFPKTYRFGEDATAHDVIKRLLEQFDKEIAEVDLSKAEKRGYSLADVVTMGSIIEREARIADERPLVSSVIYNRLKRDMKLEMCATVDYVLPGTHFRLTYDQTRTKSPYNTYLHKGLTPGPVSNPGLASLQAAAHPADTDYIFYVLTGKDGSQTFASNSEEFLRAKQKSKEVFGE
jgi:UPF0755 protein